MMVVGGTGVDDGGGVCVGGMPTKFSQFFIQPRKAHKMTALDFDDEIQQMRMADAPLIFYSNANGDFPKYKVTTGNSTDYDLDAKGVINASSLSDALLEDTYRKLANRLYNTPAIIRCSYCHEWAAIATRCGGCGAMVGQ